MKRKIIQIIIILTSIILLNACGNSNKDDSDMHALNIEIKPDNKELIFKSPNQQKYKKGTSVIIKPLNTKGYIFKGWTGKDSEAIENNKIIIDNDKNLSALFEKVDVYKSVEYYNDDEKLTNRISYEYNDNLSIRKEVWYDTLNKVQKYYVYNYENLLLKTVQEYSNNGLMKSEKFFTYNDNLEVIETNVKSNYGIIEMKRYNRNNNILEVKNMLKKELKTKFYYNSNGLIDKEEVYIDDELDHTWEHVYSKDDIIEKIKKFPDGKKGARYVYKYDEEKFSGFYELKVSVEGLGIVSPIYGEFTAGEQVQLEPVANNGYYFDGWEGIGANEIENNKITMDTDKNITAVFRKKLNKPSLNLSLHTDPKKSGMLLAVPEKRLYIEGEQVQIKYIETDGYKFSEWFGKDAGDIKSDNTLVMDTNKEVAVKFYEVPLPKSQTVYDGFGNMINKIAYEYNENKNIFKKIYYNALGRIEKYSEWIYYDGLIIRKDIQDKNGNLLKYELYEYNDNMDLISSKVFDKDNNILRRVMYTENARESKDIKQEKHYLYDEDGNISDMHVIYLIYDESGKKLYKKETYKDRKLLEIEEWIYIEDKLQKSIKVLPETGDIVEISGYEYPQNSKKTFAEKPKKKANIKTEKRDYKSKFPQVYFRGTPNNWETSDMELVDDYTWIIEMDFNKKDEFKFDITGDWQTNFGDKNNDGKAELIDPNGVSTHNIVVYGKVGKHIVVFNDFTHRYKVYEKNIFNKIFFNE